MEICTLAQELGISYSRVGYIIFGPMHVALDDDVLTDIQVRIAREYFIDPED